MTDRLITSVGGGPAASFGHVLSRESMAANGCSHATRIITTFCAVVIAIGAFAQPAHAIRILNYNILFYGDDATFDASRTAHFQLIINAIQPDIICVQEVMNSTGYNNFRNNVLNGAGGPGGFVAAPFVNGLGGGGDNAMYYRSSAITFISNQNIQTQPSGGIRDWSMYRVRLAGYTTAAAELYLFNAHLSSGGGAAQREIEANVYRDWAEANLPNGAFVLTMGDFNLQNSSEAAWTRFTETRATNKGRVKDPLNAVGNWNNNAAFAFAHTQSPLLNLPPGGGPYTTGGLDDRFDFILASDNLLDAASGQMDYHSGTYRTWGNDGLHFNKNIIDAPTIPEGAAAANALYLASDHMPVIMEVSAPARASLSSVSNFGVVVVGATVTRTLTVANTAPVPGMPLIYTLSPPAGFTAPGGPHSANAGAPGNSHTIMMDTATAANRSGVLLVSTNAPEQPSSNVVLSGIVKNHARPSTQAGAEIQTAALDFGLHSPGGFVNQMVSVHNFGFNIQQSGLQVISASIVGDARFSVLGFAPALVGGVPLTVAVQFDDVGAAPGPHEATLTFQTSDDPTLPGATLLSSIVYTLLATVQSPLPIKGDMDGSGCVDDADVPLFIAVMLDPDAATAGDLELADMNFDGLVDGGDIGLFTAAAIAGCP